MADFGFCGPAYEAPSIYQNAQETINWRIEIDQTKQPNERGYMALYPTPGLVLRCTPAVAEVRALETMPGGTICLAIVGNGLYSIDSTYTATLKGALATNSGPVQITTNSLSAYFGDGANRYAYDLTTGVLTTIAGTDGAFTGADRCDIVDNFIVYNRPGTQQWGATSALSTASPALSFSSKDGAPDNLIAAFVHDRQVHLLGEKTKEVWINAGLFPFPFQRIPGTNIQHGLAAKNSLARLGNTFAYVSRDDRGQGIIVVAEGYAVKQISTHAVTNTLLGYDITDAVAFTYQMESHECYVVSFPQIDVTWVYDLATQLWHKWLSVDSFNTYHRHRSNCATVFNGQVLVGDYANGKIYSLDQNVYTEDGATIRRLRRCPHLVVDFNQIYYYSLQIQFQPGVGLVTGQGSNPQAMLQWSNDGGSTWSSEHWAGIGMIGKYRDRTIWRRLGTARNRLFEVVVTDPVKAVIISANLDFELGES